VRAIDFTAGESQAISEPVEGLEPGTTYIYSVCAEDAENPGDPFCSPDQSFTTDPAGALILSTGDSPFFEGSRNQGWWSGTSTNYDTNTNYFAGRDEIGSQLRNFFSFDRSAPCTATTLTLKLQRYQASGSHTYTLFDVSTPAAELNRNEGRSEAIFNDLGTGTQYGTFTVDPGDEDDILSFPLNAAAVADFHAAQGTFFSVGGRASAEEASEPEHLFAYSNFLATGVIVAGCEPG
jgi:hypothetical protein